MSLFIMDSFEPYGDKDDVGKHWVTNDAGSSTLAYITSDGRYGRMGCMEIDGGSGEASISAPINERHAYIGLGIKWLASSGGRFLYYVGDEGDDLKYWGISNAGHLELYTVVSGPTDSLDYSTASQGWALHQNRWYFLEFGADIGGGGYNLRYNEEVLLGPDPISETSGPSYYSSIRIEDGPGGTSKGYRLDDVYVSTSGFLGDVSMRARLPVSDAAPNDFAPLAGGANYVEVDDAAIDDDTSFNASDVVGAQDLFGMESFPSGLKVAVLAARVARRKTGTGNRESYLLFRPGSSIVKSAADAMPSDYEYHQAFQETNPDTGSPWTASEVDACDLGYEVAG